MRRRALLGKRGRARAPHAPQASHVPHDATAVAARRGELRPHRAGDDLRQHDRAPARVAAWARQGGRSDARLRGDDGGDHQLREAGRLQRADARRAHGADGGRPRAARGEGRSQLPVQDRRRRTEEKGLEGRNSADVRVQERAQRRGARAPPVGRRRAARRRQRQDGADALFWVEWLGEGLERGGGPPQDRQVDGEHGGQGGQNGDVPRVRRRQRQDGGAAAEAQQQFGADRDARLAAERQALSAAESLSGQSAQLAALGEKARAGDIESAQLLEKIAKDRQAREQAGLDLAYEDFIRQRDMPREDLTFLSSILRGVPVQPSTETTKFQQYNPIQDLLGTGIAGLGLYRGLTGG